MNNDNQNKEPWNKPIYEQEEPEDFTSRSQLKTNKPKKSNSIFISMLVILLLAIAILLVYWFNSKSESQVDKALNKPIVVQKDSSTSSQTSTTETTTSDSATQAAKQAAERAAKEKEAKEAAEKAKQDAEAKEKEAKEQNETQNEADTEQNQGQESATGTHVVQANETLYRISVNTGVSVEELQAINGLSGTDIYVGQILKLSR